MNLHSTLCLCSYRGAAGEHLAFSVSLWRLNSACWDISVGGNVLFCLCLAVSKKTQLRNGRETNGTDPVQIETLTNALECATMTLCVFWPEPH